jgi:hypothetical protein
MTQLEYYRQVLAAISAEVAATIPPGRARSLLALVRAGETTTLDRDPAPQATRPGWNLALRLCLERHDDADGDAPADQTMLAVWAERFLTDCDQLTLANLALAACTSGYLQLQQRTPRTFVAWATSHRLSTEQRERADFGWWSAHMARQVASHRAILLAERDRMRALLRQEGTPPPESAGDVARDPAVERYYRQLGQVYVARFACQHNYPTDATIGGATFGQYTATLALLIGWLHRERDRRAPDEEYMPAPQDERAIIAVLADALDADPVATGRALQPFILDRDNAAYHSALPGQAAPPLIRLDAGRVIWSARGLLGEPLIFLARELRRRHAQEYHNSAHLREGVFRQDLYRLFGDRRFILSAGRVELKRSGEARTDLDALIFDRKTGTLGVFELKAQDPFARSVEERERQRDNFFHANRQVSAILEWVQRHGPDDLLARFDERAAKRFHVQKVYVFVLGRYLAHFTGGPGPDRRAAWGSWSQVLQAVENGTFTPNHRNPLGALFARLHNATPPGAPSDADSREIAVGDLRLRIFPSFAAMRAAEDGPA